MKLIQISGVPVATRAMAVATLVFVLLSLTPGSLQAETIAEETQKIAQAAQAAKFFSRLAEEQKAAGDFWLCFRFAAAAGAAAEAAAHITRHLTDQIDALPAAQQSQHSFSLTQIDNDSKAARQSAESVQGYVMQGLGLITVVLLIFMTMVIWLIRRGAIGPFIKKPEELG
jgi:hypothetical protein